MISILANIVDRLFKTGGVTLNLGLVSGIEAAGQLTPELEEQLKGVITDFLASYKA